MRYTKTIFGLAGHRIPPRFRMNSLRAWTNTDLASGEVHAYGLAAAGKHVMQIRMG